MWIYKTHNLWKFGEDTVLQTWMVFDYVWKFIKSVIKSTNASLFCSYIWHIDISKCVFWLYTKSMKVWWRYKLPNSNNVHYCDIFSRHRAVFRACHIIQDNIEEILYFSIFLLISTTQKMDRLVSFNELLCFYAFIHISARHTLIH